MDKGIFLSTIPELSTNYKDDKRIIEYCNENINSPKCKCINPDNSIKKLQLNSFNPYYCWYPPCFDSNNYKTSIIDSYQKSCNIILCKTDISKAEMDKNGKLIINNTCVSEINMNRNFISQELIEESLRDNYILPNIFINTHIPIFLCIFCSLLLLK